MNIVINWMHAGNLFEYAVLPTARAVIHEIVVGIDLCGISAHCNFGGVHLSLKVVGK